jgi:hypothetical protein
MLPELPGREKLDYEDILEILAHGVTNLRQFLARTRERDSDHPILDNADTRVPYIEKLSVFIKAIEGLRKRLSGPLSTPADARAQFNSDLGFNRIVDGLSSDDSLDSALRFFVFLELFAMLDSIKWCGTKKPKKLAQDLSRRAKKRLKCLVAESQKEICADSKELSKVKNIYVTYGNRGWRRP